MSVCVIGSLNLDFVCRVDLLPRPGETVAALGLDRLPGGKGANQAVAAARCGAEVTLIGAVGQDDAGDALLASLTDAGVDVLNVARVGRAPTGQAFVWVSAAGENSIVVVGGANLEVGVPGAALKGHTVFLAQLETPAAAIETAFASDAAKAGIRILNAAPATEAGRGLLPLTDILIVNQTELSLWAGGGADEEAALRLLCRPGQTVIVTLGAAGALAVSADCVLRVQGRPARVFDTTGAGDCFCGVLAARLATGAPLGEALAWANAAASLSTERPGAAPAMPNLAEIEAALR